MQGTPLDPLLARVGPGGVLGATAAIAAAAGATAWFAAPSLGLAAAGAGWEGPVVGVALAAVGGGLAWRSRQLRALPLEVGPRTVSGEVDGIRTWRFRVRLGRGRGFVEPVATVVFEPPSGPPIPLEAWTADRASPGARFVGPLTVLAADPDRRCVPGGSFTVAVRVRADGREWRAERRVPATTAEGWFGPGFDDARSG